KLKHDVVTPLRQDPSLADALTDLVGVLEKHDEDGLLDVGDEFDAAEEAAARAAEALEAYGALSCADLINSFLSDEDASLNA
ncbi:MAG: hypothetical protein QOE05_3809, partial [Actinomycetota bacterium]|nr:hypothetical protein [Actinomycetota bacterium]